MTKKRTTIYNDDGLIQVQTYYDENDEIVQIGNFITDPKNNSCEFQLDAQNHIIHHTQYDIEEFSDETIKVKFKTFMGELGP